MATTKSYTYSKGDALFAMTTNQSEKLMARAHEGIQGCQLQSKSISKYNRYFDANSSKITILQFMALALILYLNLHIRIIKRGTYKLLLPPFV